MNNRDKHAFTADDCRKMAARFDLLLADADGLTVCTWVENDGPALGDGNYIPAVEESTIKEMLLYAAQMAEERNTRKGNKPWTRQRTRHANRCSRQMSSSPRSTSS